MIESYYLEDFSSEKLAEDTDEPYYLKLKNSIL